MLIERDLRSTPVYAEVRDYFREINATGADRIIDAADVTVSPDGAVAAFTGTIHNDIALAPVARVCLLRLDSGAMTRMADGRGNDRLPRWSPDGRWLAFISDRHDPGNFQLHLCAADATGAAILTPAVDGIVEAFQWSPDGRRILLVVAGFGADLAGCQGGATTIRKRDEAEVPAWLPVIDTGDAGNLWRSLYVYEVQQARATKLATAGINCWEATWLGNDRIVAVTSPSHSEGSWYRAQITCFSLDGGAPHILYKPADQVGLPAASPSGRALAIVEAVCSDRLIVAGNLLLIDPLNGAVRCQDTRDVDVTHAVWRDDRSLVFAGHRGLETVVGEVNVESGHVLEHWTSTERTFGNWYPTMWPAPRGGCIAIGEAYGIAPEVALIRDGQYRVVTSFDARPYRDERRAAIEPVLWNARDGREMQGWIVKPAGPGPFPLVMDIHGGPVWTCRNRWQGRLRGTQMLTEHGCAVFYPNPRGSSGRGLEFARLVAGDMGGEDTYDYLTGIDELVATGVADPKRLGVTGISYGGFMSAWLITQDTRFAAAAPISCVSNWYSQHRTSQVSYFDEMFLKGSASEAGGLFFKRSPALHAKSVRTPTLQLTGALDQNTPPTQALEFHRSLLECGVKSVLVTYPTAGHGIRGFPEVIDATTRYVSWFLEHLGRERR
jgi:dipeptidyl aminopeptidase/acylaminoacyl peptidase